MSGGCEGSGGRRFIGGGRPGIALGREVGETSGHDPASESRLGEPSGLFGGKKPIPSCPLNLLCLRSKGIEATPVPVIEASPRWKTQPLLDPSDRFFAQMGNPFGRATGM
jgi:hypothetical protein